MKLIIVLLLIAACTTSTHQVPEAVKFLAEDAQIRRNGVSYSTSVIHQNPKYPDQRAESSVKVDFNNLRSNLGREVQIKPNSAYQSAYAQKRPKSIPAFNYQHQQSFSRQPTGPYSVEENIQQPTGVYTHIQTAPYNTPDSQSFNVGYSVSFTGNAKPELPRSLSRQRLEGAEIITGSRKDIVQKPNAEFEADDYVNNAFIDIKKQKVSGIKPKTQKISGNKDIDAKTFINNLAPKTQQYLSYLGDAKPIASSNTRFRQQLQSGNAQNTNGALSTWTNLSPSVEIYRSQGLQQKSLFTPKQKNENSKLFNHSAALGTSQGFDFTNALEAQSDKNQVIAYQPYAETGAPNAFEQTDKGLILGNSYTNLLGNQAINTLPSFTNNNPITSLASTPVIFNTLQIPQQNSETPQVLTKHIPISQTGTGISHNVPVDNSLVREPVLVPSGKPVPNDPNILPIHFDTRMLQGFQQLSDLLNDDIKSYVPLQASAGITAQKFQGQLENTQVQQLPAFQQNAFQGHGFQGLQQFQGQQLQETSQVNAYGIPQTKSFLNNGFDQYFDKYYDKLQPQESRFDNIAIRNPNININNNNNRLRLNKSSGIHVDLRPPPLGKVSRHRRMYKANNMYNAL